MGVFVKGQVNMRLWCFLIALSSTAVFASAGTEIDGQGLLSSLIDNSELAAAHEKVLRENEILKNEVAELRNQLAIRDIQDDEAFENGETNDVDISTKSKRFQAILSHKNYMAITGKVKYTGTSTHPKWEVKGRWKGGKMHVSCPCAIKGKMLSHEQAFRRILGQVGAVGITKKECRKVISGDDSGGYYQMKMALATTKMYACWKHRCAGSTEAALNLQFGGGTEC